LNIIFFLFLIKSLHPHPKSSSHISFSGDDFRYGTMRWTDCDIFADPLFLDVCSVKGAWDQANSAQSMIANADIAVANFVSGACTPPSCPVVVTKRCLSSSCVFTNERRIGYRSGFVESAPRATTDLFPLLRAQCWCWRHYPGSGNHQLSCALDMSG
jgi:hypothetical protein